ncbi:MAG TPA: archaeal heat shock protein Hsp20 [Nitrososphaeraceae archaeon]|nr:archaeal heat shock protein Hsp20 [Nitrososphaeraceae archaeon]
MNFWDIEPEDWLRGGRRLSRGHRGDIFGQFDEMRREMERMFEDQFKDMQTKAPKDLIREYETPEGRKVREMGPFVYGYSMTIGPDGKPRVREFGNIRSPLAGFGLGASNRPLISSEREPLADITITDKEVKVVLEMPGVNKEHIKINVNDNSVEVNSNDPQRKYHEVIDLPPEVNIETAKSTYKNGILEITFNKKKESQSKGKDIKIE